MAYFQGMSHTEIATALGQPLGTVKDRIRTGMMHLRKRLGRIYKETGTAQLTDDLQEQASLYAAGAMTGDRAGRSTRAISRTIRVHRVPGGSKGTGVGDVDAGIQPAHPRPPVARGARRLMDTGAGVPRPKALSSAAVLRRRWLDVIAAAGGRRYCGSLARRARTSELRR